MNKYFRQSRFDRRRTGRNENKNRGELFVAPKPGVQPTRDRPGPGLDFQIPCSHPVTPGFYPRCLLTKQEGHALERLREDGIERLKEPEWQGRRRPEKPWL